MEESRAWGSRRALVALSMLALGLFADQVMHSNNPGIGMPLVAIAGSVILLVVARPRPWAIGLVAAGIAVSAFMAVRTNLPLLQLDFVAGIGLAIIAASFAQAGNPVLTGFRSYVLRGFRMFFSIPGASGILVPPIGALQGLKPVRRAIRALLIVGGALFVFGIVLSAADPVFAHVISTPFRVSFPLQNLANHAATTIAATIAAAIVVHYATRVQTAEGPQVISLGFSLGRWESAAVLAAVDALFGLFVAIQFAYLFGGNARVVRSIGLTYAQYARSGFAQMVVAALLALALIGAVWVTGGRDNGRMFKVLGGTLIALTFVVLVSAFHRLALYEGAFGWTRARLFGHAIILWLGAFLVCSLVAVIAGRAKWLTFAGIALAFAALVALNVMNADRFIAERNLARYRAIGKIDAVYLTRLSDDAVPLLIQALPSLPADARATLERDFACRKAALDEPRSWLAWNYGMEKAQSALDAVSIAPNRAEANPAGCDVSF